MEAALFWAMIHRPSPLRGGAHMWMEERGGAINQERAREAAETGAQTLAVACPFCTVMLDDGARANGSALKIVDVATLLVEGIERHKARTLAQPQSPPEVEDDTG